MPKDNTYTDYCAYTKTELGLKYFPTSTPHAAVNHIMSWINNDPELLTRLKATGYKTKAKMFTPRQVQLIFEEFGEP